MNAAPTLILEIADDSFLKKEEPIIKPARPKNYLNNKDLMYEIKISKTQGKMTNKLAHMLQTLCKRYASKGNYAGYTYNDDMQSYAMMQLCTSWKNFNEEKSSNPFAYYTQCIKSSFAQYLNSEKKQRDIRDTMLVEAGMNPSYTYQLEHSMSDFSASDEDTSYEGFSSADSFDLYYASND